MVSKGPSKTLFVGNLHASLEETDLLEIFKPFGHIIECCKRWCHYGFIQFSVETEAQLAYNSLNGSKIRGRPMRIEFQRKKLRGIFDNDQSDPKLSMTPYASFDAVFNQMSTEYDPIPDNTSSVSGSIDDQANFEQMTKLFDEIMSDQQALKETHGLATKSKPQPLGNHDMNRKILTEQLQQANQQSSELYLKEKKKSESIKRYSQMIKSNSNQSYLNNTSEFIKSLIHDSMLLNSNSLTNLSSSPISAKSGMSPKKAFNRALKHTNLASVNFFRSINKSHTICVEPTDVLEPLNEGEFAEYKLFPTGSKKSSVSSDFEMDVYSPSLSLSCSNLSSVSSSMANSPINNNTNCPILDGF